MRVYAVLRFLQNFPLRVHLSDLSLPQNALHKILELSGGAHHSHTLIFEVREYLLPAYLLPTINLSNVGTVVNRLTCGYVPVPLPV